ncbi:MAG: hypothetical protein V2J24_00390 [Pseudomonadales bacterium]|jgi:hypothetical protein|nr:hypothetical protein [Pseudomonadales bacterium]
MADDKPDLRETTGRDEQRRNPRFPNSTVWSEEQRRKHRDERDATIEDAGLVTDRRLGNEPGDDSEA